MANERDEAKRWRPRFTVKTLLIVVTRVCCYAACWKPTYTTGVADVLRMVDPKAKRTPDQLIMWIDPRWSSTAAWGESATMPLVVGINTNATRHYYFWFFGNVAKLPYEQKLKHPDWSE